MPAILIADDIPEIRKFLRGIVTTQAHWYVCGEAEDGRQAVEMAREKKPDLIVLDLSMPRLNGIEAAAQILSFSPSVPIVLYTQHLAAAIEPQAQLAGVSRVISKGSDSELLVNAMRALLPDADHSYAATPPPAQVRMQAANGSSSERTSPEPDTSTAKTPPPNDGP